MRSRARLAASLLLAVTVVRDQTIQIDWAMEAAGQMAPRLVGLEDDAAAIEGAPEPQTPEETEEEAYEEAWWQGGFGEYTQNEWFGASSVVRTTKPAAVQYSVGMVYRHSTTGALGVVVGWDAETRAPRGWVRFNAGQLGASLARLRAPHYSVLEQLEDANGELRFMSRYIVGDWIQVFGPAEAPLRHPDIMQFFSGFEAGSYKPKQWLAERYPLG